MQCLPVLRVGAALLALVFPHFQVPASAQDSSLKISTPEQIKEDFAAVPCEDRDRLAAVKSLFERAGVSPSEVTIDKHKRVENLVVTIKGVSPEKIVVGAHYDKMPRGCGAIDNWSGIVTLAHLYKTLKSVPLKKTLVFMAFGKEEKGLVGSRAMTNTFTKEQAAEYCAMINIDSLGLAPPQVADNMSSKKLGQFTEDLAKEMKLPFSRGIIPKADSDSTAFLEKKIPAVTIHGMNIHWKQILHKAHDESSRVNPLSVHMGYRLALAMVLRLDQSSCDAYR